MLCPNSPAAEGTEAFSLHRGPTLAYFPIVLRVMKEIEPPPGVIDRCESKAECGVTLRTIYLLRRSKFIVVLICTIYIRSAS